MDQQPAVYILASRRNGTLYTGVTSNLTERIWQHRNHLKAGFTDRYGATILVWFELHDTMETAVVREKRLKKWNRAWNIRLIEDSDPYWNELWPHISGQDQDTGSPPARG